MDDKKLEKVRVECKDCKWFLSPSDFAKTKNGGRQSICRDCLGDRQSKGHDYAKEVTK